ncbi:MAG: orotidine-5'-phosphate decarboxylase [Sphingomicrobium sp.]
MTSPIYVAIDTPDMGRARAIAAAVKRHAGGIKLGLEFFCHNGRSGVLELAELGLPLFLDLKFHDIPNTVAKAIQALSPLTPSILTVHAAGGRSMMEDARAAAPVGTRIVAVTMLTSLDETDLVATGVRGSAHDQVARLADVARVAGLDGIVCSGREVAAARKRWKDGLFVVPGIRPVHARVGDQKRVMTPRCAIDQGASILVIGRPVTEAADPDAALRAIAATL